jgi:ABC-2 type transport system permease protein
MKQQIQAISAEFTKNKHSRIRWVTFVAFAIAPVMGGVFLLIMKGEGFSGALKSKAVMMSFEANWDSYLGLLSQAVGVGGVLVFGFVASWLFGREYSDGTAKDLLALPISRTKILNAKYIYYSLWCFALVIFNLILGLLIGFSFQLEGWSISMFIDNITVYFITTLLIILLNTPIAFFALWGKGYLPPLGVVALLLVFSQIIGAIGLGSYFPWSVPGLYSGSGGEEFKMQLNTMSFVILIATSIIGYLGTVFWWKYADQK